LTEKHHVRIHVPSLQASADALKRALAGGASPTEVAQAVVETYMLASPPLPSEDPKLPDKLLHLAYGDEDRSKDEKRILSDAYHSLWFAWKREEARRLDPLPLVELSKLLEDKIAMLRDLWGITHKDWVLEIHHVLTEPVCPSVVIRPEGSNALRFAVHADSIVEAIVRSVDLVHRDVILGERIVSESPMTNSDDHTWPEVAHERDVDLDDPRALSFAYQSQQTALHDAQNALLGERIARRRLEERVAQLEGEKLSTQ
jgi:hypothetical protein